MMAWTDPLLVKKMTLEGLNAKEIAIRLGISRRQVLRLRRKTGVIRERAPVMTEEEIERARILLEDGCPYNEVARTLGRCPETIRNRFPGFGLSKQEVALYSGVAKRFFALHSEIAKGRAEPDIGIAG